MKYFVNIEQSQVHTAHCPNLRTLTQTVHFVARLHITDLIVQHFASVKVPHIL